TWHPAPIMAHMVTRWIETGQARRVLDATRTEVRARQAVVAETLAGIEGYRGSSALHFWLPAPPGIDSTQFAEAIAEAGLIGRAARLYAGDGAPRAQGVRPAVGEVDSVADTRRAVETLRDVYRKLAAAPALRSVA